MRSRSARGFRPAGNQSWRKAGVHSKSAFGMRDGEYLYDVVDCDHQAGTVDASFRPNQIFAVGGLPLVLLSPEKARKVVDAVEARLLTPLGLRSLAPGEPGYVGHYGGGAAQRDGSYHQGTVWPWLMGPFVEAWVRVARRLRRDENRSPASVFSCRSSNISIMPGSVTSPRLPMAMPHTRRQVAHSRPGR